MAKGKGPSRPETAFSPRCFTVALVIYPAVPMVRESALEFAKTLGARHELPDIHMSDESWVFRRPQTPQAEPRGLIRVVVEEQEIKIEHQFPTGRLEQFEKLVDDVVAAVERSVKPEVVLASTVSLEYVTELGADARQAILDGLRLSGEDDDGSDKMAVFGRPCHSIGFRLTFPPYAVRKVRKEKEAGEEETTDDLMEKLTNPEEEGSVLAEGEEKEGADWQATVTVESLQDNPRGISVEVDGRWLGSHRWRGIAQLVNQRLATVEQFLTTRTVESLKFFRSDQ